MPESLVDLWLDNKAANTRKMYRLATRRLVAFSGKDLDQITRMDMAGWAAELRRRKLSGATINLLMAAVSSYYKFLIDALGVKGIENPVGRTCRERVNPYGRSRFLQPEDAIKLIGVLEKAAEVNPLAARDYALFLGYLILARRNSEWRAVKWGDFEKVGKTVTLMWRGKNKVDQRIEVSAPVWKAVRNYLTLAGRIRTIAEDEYVFPGVVTVGRQEMAIGGPLSSDSVNRRLRYWAGAAGISGEIHCHMLRHCGAMIRRGQGQSIESVSKWLGHSSVNTTAIYLHSAEGEGDAYGELVFDALKEKQSG